MKPNQASQKSMQQVNQIFSKISSCLSGIVSPQSKTGMVSELSVLFEILKKYMTFWINYDYKREIKLQNLSNQYQKTKQNLNKLLLANCTLKQKILELDEELILKQYQVRKLTCEKILNVEYAQSIEFNLIDNKQNEQINQQDNEQSYISDNQALSLYASNHEERLHGDEFEQQNYKTKSQNTIFMGQGCQKSSL